MLAALLLALLPLVCVADRPSFYYIGMREMFSTAPGVPSFSGVEATRYTFSDADVTVETYYAGGAPDPWGHDVVRIDLKSGNLTATDVLKGSVEAGSATFSIVNNVSRFFGTFQFGPSVLAFTYVMTVESDSRVSTIVVPKMAPFQQISNGRQVAESVFMTFVANIFKP